MDSAGNKTVTTITNTSYPLTSMLTETRKTTRIAGGVATETTTIPNTFRLRTGLEVKRRRARKSSAQMAAIPTTLTNDPETEAFPYSRPEPLFAMKKVRRPRNGR